MLPLFPFFVTVPTVPNSFNEEIACGIMICHEMSIVTKLDPIPWLVDLDFREVGLNS